MSDSREPIPEASIAALARSYFNEASRYGFCHADYVRFVTEILDLLIQNHENLDGSATRRSEELKKACHSVVDSGPVELPCRGELVTVRAFDADSDSALVSRWVQDERGRYFLLSSASASVATWPELAKDPSAVLGTITTPDDSPIGVLAYLDYHPGRRKAELRKLIGEPSMRGKGLAREATQIWIRYGISALGLAKIYLSTLDSNIRNLRLNEDLGFKVEGLLRNEVFFDGRYHDVLRMGLWAGPRDS